jgi:DNA processing protein
VTPRRLSDAERLAWLRLARTETVGPVAFDHLLTRFGSAERALQALPDLARRGGRASPLRPPPRARSRRELETGGGLGARLICACEPDFPPAWPPSTRRRRCSGRWAGRDPAPAQPWPSSGPASPRPAGQRFARAAGRRAGPPRLCGGLGLARGIDGAAHEGALATGTVAVLGGGV